MSSPPTLRAPQLTPIPEASPQLAAPMPAMKQLSPPNAMAAAVVLPAPGLPLSYYADIPDQVPAIFSTALETQPKRKLVEPYPLSIIRTDLLGDVQRKCESLWKKFPNETSRVRNSSDWYQLYRYFDAVDLWVEGPVFCFAVIDRLATVNLDILTKHFAMISEYAQGWVQLHSKRLLTVPEHVSVWDLFTPKEIEDEEFDMMTEEEIATVKGQLEYHRYELLVKHNLAGPAAMAPIQPAQDVVGYRQPQYPSQGPINQHLEYPRPEVAHQIVPMELGHPVRTPQTYTNFMQNQRNIHGPVKDNRTRAYSNVSDTNRGGRGARGGTFRYNVYRHQNTRVSPQKQEPVYVLTGQRAAPVDSTPRYHTGQRGVSLDLSSRPNVPADMRQRAVSGVVTRPLFSNDARNDTGRRFVSEEVNTRTFSGHSRVTSNSSAGVGHSNYHGNGGHQFRNDARVSQGNYYTAGYQFSNDARVIQGQFGSPQSNAGTGHPYHHANGGQPFSNGARIPQSNFGSPQSHTGHSRITSNSSVVQGHPHYYGNGGHDQVNDAQLPQSKVGSPQSTAGRYRGKERPQPCFTDAEWKSIEYEKDEGANGAVTIYYSGPRRPLEHESTPRTVYVWGISRALFLNNTLRNMMSECGDVDTISHLATAPQSFVAFHDDRSVQRAIYRWDGEMIEGVKISVSAARPRNGGTRERGFSMSGNYWDNEFHRGHIRNTSQNTVRDWGISSNYGDNEFHRARNGSENTMRNGNMPSVYQDDGYGARNISETSMHNEQFHHYIPEHMQGQQVPRPFQPLQDIRNLSPPRKSALHNYNSVPGVNLKENSPFATPRKNGTSTPQKKKNGNRKKGSRQSSRQHTPSTSPRKHRPENRSTLRETPVGSNGNQLDSTVSNEVSRPEHVVERPTSALALLSERVPEPNQAKTATTQKQQSKPLTAVTDFAEHSKETPLPIDSVHPENNPPSAAARKKYAKKFSKKKLNFMKSGDNASFSTDTSSDTIVSPSFSTDNASFMTSQSTNTSFSTASSRQPSVGAKKARKTGYMGENNEIPGFTSEAHKEGEQKVESNLENTKAPKPKNKKPSKPTTTAGEPVHHAKESGHSKKESISSSTINPSQRKADTVVKSDHRPTPIAIHPPVNDAVAKKAGNVPTPIPTPATDALAKKEAIQAAPAVASSPTEISKNQETKETASSPSLLSPVKQLDEQEWPSLNPAKSPVAAIADGKPPTPMRAPLMGFLAKAMSEKSPEPKKAPKSIFPPVAVPRSFSGRSPSVQQPTVRRPPVPRPPIEQPAPEQPIVQHQNYQQPTDERPARLRVLPGDPGSEEWPFVKNFKAQ
ncbi:uncharacterized protein PAC_01689 [Phialocephala subalpina]|uniref:RRM domain-containing protein n=1 Tax=Phialocephala subalpina TaxID=576137 RepID=A0A1L7WGA5_9HELO|nr:uncharacterized protein PAC_01689 [Phialocephala subalpina]